AEQRLGGALLLQRRAVEGNGGGEPGTGAHLSLSRLFLRLARAPLVLRQQIVQHSIILVLVRALLTVRVARRLAAVRTAGIRPAVVRRRRRRPLAAHQQQPV